MDEDLRKTINRRIDCCEQQAKIEMNKHTLVTLSKRCLEENTAITNLYKNNRINLDDVCYYNACFLDILLIIADRLTSFKTEGTE